jgi:hypothetical protein
MQDKKQKKSPIKQRILQFIGNLNISKREFYLKTGISRGTLESNTGITEDILAKFIATYPNINIEWLIIGKETNNEKNLKSLNIIKDNKNELEIIQKLSAENALLKKEIEELKGYNTGYNNIAAEP